MKKAFIGLTVMALMAMVAAPALAFLPYGPFIGPDIVVMNDNYADVINHVEVSADTGDNDAEGEEGEEGGDGGDVNSNTNSGGIQTNTGGAGGAGGTGGDGGTIITGDAFASAFVTNMVNTNETDIDACACPPEPYNPCPDPCNYGCDSLINGPCYYDPCPCLDDIVVDNNNFVFVDNGVGVDADTGDNDVDGEEGEEGGDGGDADCNDNEGCGYCWPSNQTNTGGDGGDGGTGGNGGTVTTGSAWAQADIINMINSNITRIWR